MKKKYLVLSIILFILLVLGLKGTVYGADLDRITNYVVTVEPRMNDGTLDITYEITWKVLDSTTEGPLTWVQIGTPNDEFDSPTALSNNIKSIRKYSGSYVRIDFKKAYNAGDEITFKYSIHQPYMYKLSGSKCKFEFTPAWFTDASVDHLTIKWNKDSVKKSNSDKTEDNYLIWEKVNLSKGEKLKTKVEYKKSEFGYLSEDMQRKGFIEQFASSIFIVIIFVIIIILSIRFGGGGYYGHSGFYGGGYRGFYGGGCVHSSCACAHSSCAHSSCACACAGSGRAGCSKKDFYGTNITTEKLKKVLKK